MNFSKELTVFLLGISFAVCAGGSAESIVRSGKTFVYSPRYQYADEPRSFAGGLPVFYRRNPEECSINSIPRMKKSRNSGSLLSPARTVISIS